ncbi:MAG: glycerate kinase [Anaerolineae bacterium]|uniref:glycerate kinase type-2 family protein n=1 Tax=Candidatus Amarolinea dominans TaxID=3140696 RepID=UPI003136F28E|nr:glycerate kinase [Anaerolineae bacterium]
MPTRWETARVIAAELQQAALQAADPGRAVARHVRRDGPLLTVGDQGYDLSTTGRLFLLSVGKASLGMAAALLTCLGPWAQRKLGGGLIVLPEALVGAAQAWRGAAASNLRIIGAGHPLPSAGSVVAGQAALELLQQATPADLVICLLSGGGSALLTAPAPGLSLADLQATTQLLLRGGATIHELNAVRKHLDQVKGGGLALAAGDARLCSLILSDVPGDRLDVIASGPTAPDPSTFADAWAVIERVQGEAQVPAAVRQRLQAGRRGELPETLKPEAARALPLQHQVIGSNRLAVEAVAQAAADRGLAPLILATQLAGEAREVGRVLAAIAGEVVRHGRPQRQPACLVAGGETTVTVRGRGRGGRSQELALAAALSIGDAGRPVGLLSFGTDGIDGPTDAAGAWVDDTTVARAQALGLDPLAALANNDAYPFFAALGDLIITGPTGTNVNDVVLILVGDMPNV